MLLIEYTFYAYISTESVTDLFSCDGRNANWQILKDTVGENTPLQSRKSKCEMILFASWGRIALATVSATQKKKQEWR